MRYGFGVSIPIISQRMKILSRIGAALSVILLILAAYVLIFRPPQLQYGATQFERLRTMPAEDIEPNPTFYATRAITIDTTPEAIWPWMIQMGYDRAGFYGYDIIEGIGSKTGMKSAERIIPELQQPNVGDEVPISAAGSWRFHAIERPNYFVWSGYKPDGTPDGGFIWALYPNGPNSTRLVSRVTWRHHFTQPTLLAWDIFTEFADHVAVRKILTGIKARVEGKPSQSFFMQSAEFFYFVATLLVYLVALVLLIIKPLNLRQYLFALASGLIFLFTWYTRLPIPLGIVMALVVIMWYRWPRPLQAGNNAR